MTIPFSNAASIHLILETIAFFVGIRIYYFLRKDIQDPISDMNRLWILLGAMIGALLGSRIIALFENPNEIAHQTWLTFYQNKTIAGGFFGGLFGVELCKKLIGVKIASGDIYVIPILTALIIGRIGCFGMGVLEPAYGIETTFFTGMNLGDGKLRHPVALYEIMTMVLLIIGFTMIKKQSFQNGDRFKMFMIAYFLYRFLVEFIKPYHSLFLNLSVIHWVSIFIFVYYHQFFIRISKPVFNAK
jgi:prolipoprotein diacylglyceryltransferase